MELELQAVRRSEVREGTEGRAWGPHGHLEQPGLQPGGSEEPLKLSELGRGTTESILL